MLDTYGFIGLGGYAYKRRQRGKYIVLYRKPKPDKKAKIELGGV